MSDIFISYARADRPKAQLLAKALEQRGWSVWWDLNIRIGDKFDEVIKKELDAAKCVVVLWSSKSILSEWVKDEAAEAAGRGILVPALIEDVELPFGFGFRRIQASRLADWHGSLSHPELIRLLNDLSALIENTPVKMLATQSSNSKLRRNITGVIAVISVLILGIYLAIHFGKNFSEPKAEQSSPIPKTIPTTEPGKSSEPAVSYQQMTENERIAFVDNRARQISMMIAGREYMIPPNSRLYIKKLVDMYAERIGNGSKVVWSEDLNFVFKRAANYTPFIIFVFKEYDVPPIIGIYLAMIESEYHECLTSRAGATGLFQFIPETARHYGVAPADRCKPDKITPAAARYIKDNLTLFESDSMKVALSILAFNQGEETTQQYLNEFLVLNEEESEVRFWSIVSKNVNLEDLSTGHSPVFEKEAGRYIHAFFAAAIVGEFPQSFGLETNPLSTYVKMSN